MSAVAISGDVLTTIDCIISAESRGHSLTRNRGVVGKDNSTANDSTVIASNSESFRAFRGGHTLDTSGCQRGLRDAQLGEGGEVGGLEVGGHWR